MVSSTDGSPTRTGWKRRSRAASFSTCLRYSSSVVAPMQRSSPRASAGLSMLAASAAPSAAPAPTIVCSSSMKRITWPCASVTSRSTALSRSSNSPRYFAPAIIAPMSSAISRRSFRVSGTSPATMRWARPSAIAVLPTPGSPISTGLFLVRRESTWTTRRISSSRPITGSILPWRAASVRSRPNFASAWYFDSGSWSVTRAPPRTEASALSSASRPAPAARSSLAAGSLLVVCEREQQVLGRDVLVLQLRRPRRRRPRGLATWRVRAAAWAPPLTFGSVLEQRLDVALEGVDPDPELLEHGDGAALGLAEQRAQQVRGLDLGVAAGAGQGLGLAQGLLALDGELVESHESAKARHGSRPRQAPGRGSRRLPQLGARFSGTKRVASPRLTSSSVAVVRLLELFL